MTWAGIVLAALGLLLVAETSIAAEKAAVSWHPSKPRVGDVAWVLVKDVIDGATVEGSVDGKPLTFFPYAGGHAALFGVDLETKPGTHAWRVGVVEPGREPRSAQGSVKIVRRDFHVERLTLPNTMVDLDPETERRAVAESKQLATLYRTITPERIWRGKFTTPVGAAGTGAGFGARRIINGQPRSPHSGSASDPELGTRLGVRPTRYEGPTGIVGVLNTICREQGFATATLWANVPHYISGIENPKATLALVRRVAPLLGATIDTADLEAAGKQFDTNLKEIVAQNNKIANYVKKLESRDTEEPAPAAPGGASDLPPAAELVAEIEQFLRQQRPE